MVRLSATARQQILVEDQIRLRLLTHQSYLELATPLRTFNRKLDLLLKRYERLPMAGQIPDQLLSDVQRLCSWLEAEIYDAIVRMNLNILETVQKELSIEYKIMGRDTTISMKEDLPPLSTWRKPFHPEPKIEDEKVIKADNTNARIQRALGHGAYDPEVAERILKNPIVTAKGFSQSTQESIKKIMYRGIRRGESTQMIAARVRQILPNKNYNKALSIVWTETHNTMNYVKWKEYMNDPAIEHIQWISVGDRRVRPTHRRNHLQIIKKGETFRNGQKFPGDRNAPFREWIHCRCTITPYIIEPTNVAHPRTRTKNQMVRYNAAGWRPKPYTIPETLRKGYKPVIPLPEVIKPTKPVEREPAPAKTPSKPKPSTKTPEDKIQAHIEKGNVKVENGEVYWKQEDGSWRKPTFGWEGLKGMPDDIIKLMDSSDIGIDDIDKIVKNLIKQTSEIKSIEGGMKIKMKIGRLDNQKYKMSYMEVPNELKEAKYLAKINGMHPQYKYNREFINPWQPVEDLEIYTTKHFMHNDVFEVKWNDGTRKYFKCEKEKDKISLIEIEEQEVEKIAKNLDGWF